MRVLGLLLFVFVANYAPIHLALEHHVGDLPADKPLVHSGDAGVLTTEEHGDSDHAPHHAADHSLRLAASARVSPVTFDSCIATVTVEVCRTQFCQPLFLTERQNPPGLPPPDPLQPRAPPLA